MDTVIAEPIVADPRHILELAARVEDWPRWLPHYRSVEILGANAAGERLVRMAARRELRAGAPVGWPLHWTAIETVRVDELALEFRHVRGITRGMWVRWQLASDPTGTVVVSIRHVFAPRWPVPDALVHAIVGEYFVNGVARRTLRCIREVAERAVA
jgi:hypothetical protein